MSSTPGTVSKILWHFTGGPEWDGEKFCQKDRPKSIKKAYKALVAIMRTKRLILGKNREAIWLDPDGTLIHSIDPICCLADIPIQHLSYHCKRYGTIAIGFRRESAVRHGFAPVLYALETFPHTSNISLIIESINNNLRTFNLQNFYIEKLTQEIDLRLKRVESKPMAKTELYQENIAREIRELRTLEQVVKNDLDYQVKMVLTAKQIYEGITKLMAYVKTFKETEFESIYCEREWRSTKEFNFKYSDVAMIVLPSKGSHHSKFISHIKTLNEELEKEKEPLIPDTVPIVPWEDLVEH